VFWSQLHMHAHTLKLREASKIHMKVEPDAQKPRTFEPFT
jgi:hypothetical protein